MPTALSLASIVASGLDGQEFSRIFLFPSKLQFIKTRIQATVREQFVVSSLLHNSAFVDDEDHISSTNSCQAMRDYD